MSTDFFFGISTMHCVNWFGCLAPDVDECMLPSEESGCFGECTNTIGSYYCRCPRRTLGNPNIEDGCIPYSNSTTGEYINLRLASHRLLNQLLSRSLVLKNKLKTSWNTVAADFLWEKNIVPAEKTNWKVRIISWPNRTYVTKSQSRSTYIQ
jgi:hypothetical protein